MSTDSIREALLDLYDKAGGDNWTDNTYWGDGNYCSWYGITCNDGKVTAINLKRNNLIGTITDKIGLLTDLEFLTLSYGDMWGEIPKSIGNLVNLEVLGLDNNKRLNGEIPNEIGNLKKLKQLWLMVNQFSGELPIDLKNLNNLEAMYLDNNKLSGEFFPHIRSMSELQIFHIQANQFHGEIPSWIGDMTELRHISIGQNQFSGPLPESMGQLSRLTHFYAFNNSLDGEIPNSFRNLKELKAIIIRGNRLSGVIPDFLYSPQIYIDTSRNLFTGGQPIRFDLTQSDADWKVRPIGTAKVFEDGQTLVIHFDELLIYNRWTNRRYVRGFEALVYIDDEHETTSAKSSWVPNWYSIRPIGSEVINNLELRIPLRRLRRSRLDEYELWINIFTSDIQDYDVSPPDSTEGFVSMKGNHNIESKVIKFRYD